MRRDTGEDAHVVKLIDIYWLLGAGVANRLTEDVADEAGVIKDSKRACTRCADRDAVVDAWSQIDAGLVTDSDVETTVHAVTERVITDCRVTRARCVVFHRKIAERIAASLPVLAASALRPCALLKAPSTLPKSAFVPKALLSEPLSLWTSALAPTAVFSSPVVFCFSEAAPMAVLLLPVVL